MVTIYRGAVVVDDDDLKKCAGYRRRASTIFNPDDRRTQAVLRKTAPIIKKLHAALEARDVMQRRHIGTCVVLFSRSGCKQQTWHTDYNTDTVSHLETKPMGAILALQTPTTFEEYPDTQHSLEKGDVLVFDGDVVHAGSAYDRANMRIHVYVDSVDCKRKHNATYPYPP